ncbi:MAG: hypothetical protein AB7S50_02795 [Bacteroidales bacterium]
MKIIKPMVGDMKKRTCRYFYNSLFVLLLILLTINYSCNEEDKNDFSDPEINIINLPGHVFSDSTISAGQKFIVGVEATSNGHNKLTNFIAKVNGERYLDLGIFSETFNKEIEITKGLSETDVWEFIIRDIEGNWASKSITITQGDSTGFGEIDTYLNVYLGAQNSTLYGSFFSLGTGTVYNLQDAFTNSALIDLVYYYDDFDKLEKCIMASPGANIGETAFPGEFAIANWETINTTRYSKEKLSLSIEEFDNALNDSILIANTFAFETGGRKAKLLQTGDMFAFVRDNKTGIFKVVNTLESNSGYIVVDIKIQK